MPYLDTIKKVHTFLKALSARLSKPKEISISELLINNNIPKDYSIVLISKQVVLRVGGGSRGPATYVWNKGVLPTKELAAEVISGYNRTRWTQKEKRTQTPIQESKQ